MKKRASENYKNNQIINNFQILKLDDFVRVYDTPHKHIRYFSTVKCLLCGQIKTIYTFQLKNQLSCGCKNYKNKVYSKRKLYASYKYGAITRGLSFKLSYKLFCELTNENCYYCNGSPSRLINGECKNKHRNINNLCSGLDRVDNNQGYIKSNVVPCCFICNRAKHSITYDEFINYLNRLVKYRDSLKRKLSKEQL